MLRLIFALSPLSNVLRPTKLFEKKAQPYRSLPPKCLHWKAARGWSMSGMRPQHRFSRNRPRTSKLLADQWLLETNPDDISRHVRAGLRWHRYHAHGGTKNCATHKIRRNRHEIRIFRYISSEKIRLKLSQLKERDHDGHNIRI